jgi:hypothetical protein
MDSFKDQLEKIKEIGVRKLSGGSPVKGPNPPETEQTTPTTPTTPNEKKEDVEKKVFKCIMKYLF